MKKHILEVIVFICGAAVMIIELVASRILAPFIGTSTFVWTSLIGVILGCLSIGYWLGGKLADKVLKKEVLAAAIFTAGITTGVVTFLNIPVLTFVTSHIEDYRIGAVLSTLILFAVPSILLGMVSPYAIKLKISDIDKTGQVVGNLYAISTWGSIVGTFAAGFVLIPSLGSNKILLFISIILILTSLVLSLKDVVGKGVLIALLIWGFVFSSNITAQMLQVNNLIDRDTEYSRIWIYDSKYENRHVRVMQMANEYSSAMFLDNRSDLVFDYLKFYRLAEYFKPDFKKSLAIGGAAYTYPKFYLEKYPQASIDVVEIDKEVTNLAKKYFMLDEDSRLRVYHEDGRVFVNRNTNKYDIIFGDAFRSYSVPYQLTTKEAITRIYDSLNPDGVFLLNIISSIEGESGKFLRAEYMTLKSIFPQVYVIPVTDKDDGRKVQNIMVVALKSITKPTFESDDSEINTYLKSLWKKDIQNDMPIIVDDYAPIEDYNLQLSTKRNK